MDRSKEQLKKDARYNPNIRMDEEIEIVIKVKPTKELRGAMGYNLDESNERFIDALSEGLKKDVSLAVNERRADLIHMMKRTEWYPSEAYDYNVEVKKPKGNMKRL